MHFRQLIILSFVCTLLADFVEYMAVSMQLSIEPTYIIAAMKLVSLASVLYIASKTNWKKEIPRASGTLFAIYIGWNIITIIRGVGTADNYWDWKHLVLDTSFSLLIPYVLIAGVLTAYSRDLFRLIITKFFLFGFLIIPLTLKFDVNHELYGRTIALAACFFILLSPYMKLKWRLLTFVVAATSVVLAFDFRTNLLRIGVATLLFGYYYLRNYLPRMLPKVACSLLFLAPLVFLFLGITDRFDIFNPTDDIEKYDYAYDNGSEKNVVADTRTFLYQEVFASMQSKNSFVFGEGGNGTYKTEFFEENTDYNKGRYGAEAGFLNTLLYSGIIGVLLYGAMLFAAAYYAISDSNNFLCKMLAIFLAFRWLLSFVEDIPKYDGNYYFIWIAVGLCLSKKFRAMTDADIRQYFNFALATG